MTDPSSDEELVFAAVEEFCALKDSGRAPTVEEFVARFPEHLRASITEQCGLLFGIDRVLGGHVPIIPLESDDGRRRLGDFELKRELGRGAMGVVFLAEQRSLGREVAIKVLPEGLSLSERHVARFKREAEAASKLDDPGIVTVYDAGSADGVSYIAMQYVEGETLADELARARESATPPPIDRSLSLIERVARSLDRAHEAQLIHRDIKPSNLMITPAGDPVILDFGLARATDDSVGLTMTGDLVGTPLYMSPEQLTGRIRLDRRTDVFSLGVTLYETLTLETPFDAPTRDALYQKILVSAPRDPRKRNAQISKDLAAVIEVALEKDRGRRYETARDLAEDLRRVSAREPILARPPSGWVKAARWLQRRPVVAGSLAIVSLALTVALLISLAAQRRVQDSLDRFDELADVVKLREAIALAGRLHPPRRKIVPDLERWFRDYGSPLETRLPQLERRMSELEAELLPYDEETRREDIATHPLQPVLALRKSQRDALRARKIRSRRYRSVRAKNLSSLDETVARLEKRVAERRTFKFRDESHSFLFHALRKHLADLRKFVAKGGLLEAMTERLAWARRVDVETVDELRREWDATRAAIRDNVAYGDLRLDPQVGLVPLGKDPTSGLQEFWHPRSGTRPQRDPKSGRWVITAESGLVFVLVPGGAFRMGAQARNPASANFDKLATSLEGPPHRIELAAFFMSKYEMSQGQWQRLAGANPAIRSHDETVDGRHPVEGVTRADCIASLSLFGLRVPTEAQWEYAARAGTDTPYWTGRDVAALKDVANVHDLSFSRPSANNRQRRAPFDDGYSEYGPVDIKLPNPFGLHNVIGNVAELCREPLGRYGNFLALAPGTGERGVPSGVTVFRGGCLAFPPDLCRVTSRGSVDGDMKASWLGVRPSRPIQRDVGR